jgi:hypothetical protein
LELFVVSGESYAISLLAFLNVNQRAVENSGINSCGGMFRQRLVAIKLFYLLVYFTFIHDIPIPSILGIV